MIYIPCAKFACSHCGSLGASNNEVFKRTSLYRVPDNTLNDTEISFFDQTRLISSLLQYSQFDVSKYNEILLIQKKKST